MLPPTSRIKKNATLIVMYQFPTATLDMNFSVTDSSCLAITLVVNRGIVSPPLDIKPMLIVISCRFMGGIIDLQCCNYLLLHRVTFHPNFNHR